MQQIYDPRISPLFRESLSDLSPTLVLVAEVDVLHDVALLYYKRLQKEGLPSDLKIYKGTYHGFFGFVCLWYYVNMKWVEVTVTN